MNIKMYKTFFTPDAFYSHLHPSLHSIYFTYKDQFSKNYFLRWTFSLSYFFICFLLCFFCFLIFICFSFWCSQKLYQVDILMSVAIPSSHLPHPLYWTFLCFHSGNLKDWKFHPASFPLLCSFQSWILAELGEDVLSRTHFWGNCTTLEIYPHASTAVRLILDSEILWLWLLGIFSLTS